MKKVLSILLALSLIISIAPMAFAETTGDPTSKTYELYDINATGNISFKGTTESEVYITPRQVGTTTYYLRNAYWHGYEGFDYGTRDWGIFYASDDTIKATFRLYGADDYLQVGATAATNQVKPDFALSLQAPEKSGFYIPEMKGGSASETTSKNFSWCLDLFSSEESITAYRDTADLVFSGKTKRTDDPFKATKAIYSKPGDEIISWIYSDVSYGYGFYYITLNPILNPDMTTVIKNDDDSTTSALSLNLGDNKQQTVTLHTTVKGKDTEGADVDPIQVSNNFITYKSSDEDVATVAADGTITAVGDGTAIIYAEADANNTSLENGITVTVTAPTEPEDEAAEGEVSFAQTTNIDGFTGIDIDSVNRGGIVELTAHKQNIPGYKFIGWKRGADTSDENAWVDINGDSYTVWTNTYLTAIYEKETDVTEKAVEFWNQNGAYLGNSTEETYATGVKRVPKLIGFGIFKGWFIGENEELPETFAELNAGTTNAVARYEASAVSNVTFNDNAIPGADKYNADITLPATSNATTCWKRDGETIAYGDTYKFNVWDATNITEGTEEITKKVPVAILDYSENHEAYMLEYDAGEYDIVEAGIIFGKDTVKEKRYTSQRKEKHNQFTVPEEGELEATGYIIYTLDNGANYKTKYVSVKTAN